MVPNFGGGGTGLFIPTRVRHWPWCFSYCFLIGMRTHVQAEGLREAQIGLGRGWRRGVGHGAGAGGRGPGPPSGGAAAGCRFPTLWSEHLVKSRTQSIGQLLLDGIA